MTLMLSPAGWMVLIGAAAVLGFFAASSVDSGVQKLTGYVYDTARSNIRGRR